MSDWNNEHLQSAFNYFDDAKNQGNMTETRINLVLTGLMKLAVFLDDNHKEVEQNK